MENKKYSILFIALYCYTGHLKDIVNHLKEKNPRIDVAILTNKPDDYKELADKNVKIYFYNISSVDWIKIRWLRVLTTKYKQIHFFSKFSKNKRYDIINIHFANRYMSFVYNYLRYMSNNIVITPWGSDLLRRPKKNLEQLSYLYKKADYVTLPASSSSPIVRIVLETFKIDPKKLVGSFWGTELVDFAIKKGNSISQDEAKVHFGLFGRYVITCGYNKQEEQRHKAIIQAIDQVRDQLPNNLTLLFPMTYGNWTTQANYLEDLKEECKKRELHAVFVTDFLSVEELYKLRKATDIFIHVQTTDAGARSVYEYILCEKKIVQGSWIKYGKFESYAPLFYFPVNKLDELGMTIVKAYRSDAIDIPKEVMDIVKSRSWDNKITQMNNFFMSIV